jgi:hypothetical protein
MLTYFIMIDWTRRNTKIMDTFMGKIIAGGGIPTLCFWIIWPLEVIKNNL